MTPLIQEAVKLAPEPESAMWFDVGQMVNIEQDQKVPADILINLPFNRTGLAGLDPAGNKFTLWLTKGNGSITVAGAVINSKKFIEPYAYVLNDQQDGWKIYRKNKVDSNLEEIKPIHRMLLACMIKLNKASTGFRATPQNTFINKKRQAKGKPALTFDWHTVEITPPQEKAPYQGGTHASPRLHDRRGHWRYIKKSNKQVWVLPCKVGDASKGVVFKDYKVTQ